MIGDHRASPGRRRPKRRRRGSPSIRTRVLMIVVIPSAALLVTGTSAAGYLISQGLAARDFAGFLQPTIGPFTRFEASVEQERTLSLRALGGDEQALAGLQAQWNVTNAALSNAIRLASEGQDINPATAAAANAAMHSLAVKLSAVRQGVRTRQASADEVDAFYSQLADVGVSGTLHIALSAPN